MTNPKDCDMVKLETLTRTQQAFLLKCKEIGWGKLEVQIKGGEPVTAKLLEQTFKFD